MSSCVTASGLFSLAKSNAPVVFESEDYVVYSLGQGETPVTLAERFLGDGNKAWVLEDANKGVAFTKGQVVVIPLKGEKRWGLQANGFQVVPILCYHRFSGDCDSPLCLPSLVFDQHMKFLKENGYSVVRSSDLFHFLQNGQSLPEKSVVITVDDGYRSVYDVAYPILKKYGFTATLFIYTDFVGASRNAVTWDQLREMKVNGFEVGGHSMSHTDLTVQRDGEDRKAFLDRIDKELRVSKQIIDEKLQQDTIFLAFPYGRYNSTVLGISERLGYEMAVSVKRGSNPAFSSPLTLKRHQILRRDMEVFVSRLKTFQNVSLR